MLKNKTIILLCIFLFLFSACSAPPNQVAPPSPTSTAFNPTLTKTPKPTKTPTIAPTPGPQNIADVNDLAEWVDEFVNAFGGTLTVNGTIMDSNQLTNEIRQNGNQYIDSKLINSVEYYFLNINDSPLAIRKGEGLWQEATMKIFGDLVGLKIGCLISNDPNRYFWWGDEFHFGTVTHGLRESMPDRSTIDFGWPAYQINITNVNEMDARFHGVLFHGESPIWMEEGFTQEDLDNIVLAGVEFAKTNLIGEVVVVNEARIPDSWEDPDIYWKKFGIDYVLRAFRIAREIYPEAKLIYNDTANHKNGTFATETTLLFSNTLNDEALIDYVGVQMHVDPDQYPNKEELIDIFRTYPVPIIITELDFLPSKILPQNQQDWINEATRIVFEGCLESEVCHSITFWGENDSVGWEGRSLLRDFDNNRKQAYYVAMQTMMEHLP